MFRFVAKLFGLIAGLSIMGGIASLLAALSFKRRAPAPPPRDADRIDLAMVLDGGRFASTARAFRGGRVVCWYGGLDLDLRHVAFASAGASLEVRTVFGGTRVAVAPGVPVHTRVIAIFGGTVSESETGVPSAAAPGLEISGFSVFGGLQVVVVEPGEELAGWANVHDVAGGGAIPADAAIGADAIAADAIGGVDGPDAQLGEQDDALGTAPGVEPGVTPGAAPA